jgi:hypothetical protein
MAAWLCRNRAARNRIWKRRPGPALIVASVLLFSRTWLEATLIGHTIIGNAVPPRDPNDDDDTEDEDDDDDAESDDDLEPAVIREPDE